VSVGYEQPGRLRTQRGAFLGASLVWLVSLMTFTPAALAAGPPQVSETWVTSVTSSSVKLRAKINPEGASTSYRFEYLSEAAYEANLAAAREGFSGASTAPSSGAAQLAPGSVPIAVAQDVGSLAPTTTYRYRVRALNAEGPAVFGAERVFATREPTSVFPPIDGRGYELVSPVDKGGGAVGTPEALFGGGDFQAAANGESFTFSSSSAFGNAVGAPPVSQYASTRSSSGWTTANVSEPLEAGGYGDRPDGAPYRVFSEDLARALVLKGARCAVDGTCPPSYSIWEGGSFGSLPTLAGLRLAGATPDLHHAVFEAEGNLYEWSEGGLTPIEISEGEIPPRPTGRLAAPIGAISDDGLRVYWYQLEDGPLWLYEAGASRALPETAGGAASFQAASADGRFAFYTVGSTLRRYDAVTEAAQAIASGVAGVLGASASGDAVFYQDGAGLERWEQGTIATVAPGAAIAAPSDYPPATGTARVSADGSHLAFLSAAEIPPFDNADANTGEPDQELYLWGPPPGGGSSRLLCASCNPTGERPRGSASIPGAVANGSTVLHRPRVLSAGGNRVFFGSSDRLVTPDTNSRPDVYEWEAAGVGGCAREPGCLGLVSSGRGEGGTFLDASADGRDAFFLTGESLVAVDPGSIDVYDYRAGGGFPEPESPFVCKGDACQPLPGEPEDPNPATLVSTSGNPPLEVEKLEGRRRACARPKVRRHGRCVRKHHRGARR
jgi:hypothetical protein